MPLLKLITPVMLFWIPQSTAQLANDFTFEFKPDLTVRPTFDQRLCAQEYLGRGIKLAICNPVMKTQHWNVVKGTGQIRQDYSDICWSVMSKRGSTVLPAPCDELDEYQKFEYMEGMLKLKNSEVLCLQAQPNGSIKVKPCYITNEL